MARTQQAKPARKTSNKTPDGIPHKVVQVVSGKGTDEDIRARCAESVDGWAELSERGRDDLVRLMRQYDGRPTAPTMEITVTDSGAKMIGPPEEANVALCAMRLTETFASSSGVLVDARVSDLTNYFGAKSGGATSDSVSAGIAFVHGSQPANPIEAGLATQMAATHDAAMTMLRRAVGAEYLEQCQAAGNLANKLLNTFARQAEAMAKLQRGGVQIVKHIHLDNRGGQTVIADTVVTGGSHANNGEQAYGTDLAGICAALPGADPSRDGMPIASGEGEEAMPHPWRGEGLGCSTG